MSTSSQMCRGRTGTDEPPGITPCRWNGAHRRRMPSKDGGPCCSANARRYVHERTQACAAPKNVAPRSGCKSMHARAHTHTTVCAPGMCVRARVSACAVCVGGGGGWPEGCPSRRARPCNASRGARCIMQDRRLRSQLSANSHCGHWIALLLAIQLAAQPHQDTWTRHGCEPAARKGRSRGVW
jgi:hypothetical protein